MDQIIAEKIKDQVYRCFASTNDGFKNPAFQDFWTAYDAVGSMKPSFRPTMDLPNRITDMVNLMLPNSVFNDNIEQQYTVETIHGVSKYPFLSFNYSDGVCYLVTFDELEPKLSIAFALPPNNLNADCLVYNVDGLHLAQLTPRPHYPALMEMVPMNETIKFYDRSRSTRIITS